MAPPALADVLTVYRPIRAVSSPDSPWDGVLVRAPDDRNLVLVDSAGWNPGPGAAAAGDHVLRPIDVVRRADGHDVVLPPCRERADRFLRRRAEADVPLAAGEVVTLVVSLVRACAADGDVHGTWWLSDDGRPMIVPDAGADVARHAAVEIIAALPAADDVSAELLARVGESIADPRRARRDAGALEDALFALAEPAPLGTALPARRRPTRTDEGVLAPARQRLRGPDGGRGRGGGDDGLLTRLLEVAGRLRRRRGERPARRRLPWVLAAAVVMIAVGLAAVWPAGEDGGAAPVGSANAPAASPAPTTAVSDAGITDDAGGTDETAGTDGTAAAGPVAAASAVLDGRLACTGDATCLAGILEDPATGLPAGAIDLVADRRAVALVDDYGGVVVVRVEALDASTPPQWVTLVASDGRWWIRDVHDAADPR